MLVPYVRESFIARQPETVFVFGRDGIHFVAGQTGHSHKPAISEVAEFVARERCPDTAAVILDQRIHKIGWQPIGLAKNCGVSILPPGQTIVRPYPNASIL